jgi:hypothetical protein
VLYSTQFAQRAANKKFDRFAATEAWYGVYGSVLDNLGWGVEAFAFSEAHSASGKLKLDRAALEVIQEIASGGQLAMLVKTMGALKKLSEGERAITLFELNSRRDLSGNFQLGAAEKSGGAISLALGAFRFRAIDNRGGFLFAMWGLGEIQFWTAARKMTLNPGHYAVHRDAVIAKLKAEAANYVAGLEV